VSSNVDTPKEDDQRHAAYCRRSRNELRR
jgi:hypothetical protein